MPRIRQHVRYIPATRAEMVAIYDLMRPEVPAPRPVGNSPEIVHELITARDSAEIEGVEEVVVLEGPEERLSIRFSPEGIYTMEPKGI